MKFITLFAIGLLASCAHLPTEPVDYGNDKETREAIEATINYHMSEVRSCYETALETRPTLEVRLVYKFKIDSDGRPQDVVVSESKGCAKDDPVAVCIREAFMLWKFPKGRTSETVNVSYPFTLRHSGSTFPN